MKQNRLAKVFCALFFGALLCISIYGVFFAEMEGSFDYFGTPVSLATLIRAESAMCLLVCVGFIWQISREVKNK